MRDGREISDVLGKVSVRKTYLNLGCSETTESTDEGRHEEGDRVKRL